MLKTDLSVIGPLVYALVVKVFLTAITFGIKVPAGIYVPLMVIGALFGKTYGNHGSISCSHNRTFQTRRSF